MDWEADMSADEVVVKHNLKRRSHVHNLMNKAAAIKIQFENGSKSKKKFAERMQYPTTG